MEFGEKEIEFAGNIFVLNTLRSMFWPKENCLIFSDLHLGKSAHFRKNGLAVPDDLHHRDLQNLSWLIHQYEPQKIIVVGDLIHHGNNSEVQDFCQWKLQFSHIPFVLVRGNHDILDKKTVHSLHFHSIESKIKIEGIDFLHDASAKNIDPQICGHIHPGYFIPSKVGKGIKLPAFVIKKNTLYLPAFSIFTGLDLKTIRKPAIYFPFTQKEVYSF